MITPETKNHLGKADLAELKKFREQAKEVLAETPNDADAKEVISIVVPRIQELESAVSKKSKLVKVKALTAIAEDVNGTMIRAAKDQVFEISESRLPALKGLVEAVKVLILAALLGFCSVPAAKAQQISFSYVGPFNGGATIAASSATNVTAVNTNSSASNCVVSLTTYKSFMLDIMWKPGGSLSNNITLRWSTSMDGTNWPLAFGTNAQNASWFCTVGADATNAAGFAIFHTNINPNANYWRLEWVTNSSAVALGNVTVRAWKKPSTLGQ